YTSVRVRFPLRVLFKRQLRKAAWIVSCVVARQARDELLRNSFDSRSGYFFNVNFFAVTRQHELFRTWSRGTLAMNCKANDQRGTLAMNCKANDQRGKLAMNYFAND